MPQPSSILSLHNLTIGYETALIDDLNYSFKTGEIVPVIGANGCGKSTFLKTITGFTTPLKGEIKYGNHALAGIKIKKRAELFSISFDTLTPPFSITVQELLAQSIDTSFTLKKQKAQFDRRIISGLEISPLLTLDYQTLSSGQKQRVNIARALLQNTPFVFLDEPTSALDPPHKMEVMLFLKKYASEKNICILLTVHDVEMAFDIFENIILIANQKWISGSVDEIVNSSDFQTSFSSEHIAFDKVGMKFGVKTIKI